MARRRFFVPEIRREVAELTGDDAAHLVRVLRVEPGQVFEISDNRHAYLAQVESARKAIVVFRVEEQLPDPIPTVNITLCPALIKFDRLEWLIEKATELGVARICPFAAARTEHGLLAASHKRLERWRRIALEASQQSRRTFLPEIQTAAHSLESLSIENSCKLMLDEEDARRILQQLPAERSVEDHVAILLGPEGGWTPGERTLAHQQSWQPCSLGETILRTETAGMAALAILQAAWID